MKMTFNDGGNRKTVKVNKITTLNDTMVKVDMNDTVMILFNRDIVEITE